MQLIAGASSVFSHSMSISLVVRCNYQANHSWRVLCLYSFPVHLTCGSIAPGRRQHEWAQPQQVRWAARTHRTDRPYHNNRTNTAVRSPPHHHCRAMTAVPYYCFVHNTPYYCLERPVLRSPGVEDPCACCRLG